MVPNFYFWLAALIWLGVDQVTKVIVSVTPSLQNLPIWQGVFHIRLLLNSGAAFSLFSGGSGWLKWISLLVSLGLITFALRYRNLNPYEQWGYGSILGGAVGNGIDRFMNGAVIDFLDLRLINFPVFNFADVAINVGLLLLVINLIKSSPSKPDP